MNSTEEEPAQSPSCRRQLSLMTPAGTQLSAPRRVKSAVDLVSLVMAEQLGAGRGGGAPPGQPAPQPGASGTGAGLGAGLGTGLGAGLGAGLGTASCAGPSGSGWSALRPAAGAARAGHLWQAAARRGGECQIQVPVAAQGDSFCSSPGTPPVGRTRVTRGQWVTRSSSRSVSSQSSSRGAETTIV